MTESCLSQVPAFVKLAVHTRSEGALATLILPWDVATLSANRTLGRHWGKDYHLKDDARLVARWAYLAAGEPSLIVPTNVRLLVMRERCLDDENALLGCKLIRDELIRCGLMKDDAPKYWQWDGIDWIVGREFLHSTLRKPWMAMIFRERGGK